MGKEPESLSNHAFNQSTACWSQETHTRIIDTEATSVYLLHMNVKDLVSRLQMSLFGNLDHLWFNSNVSETICSNLLSI